MQWSEVNVETLPDNIYINKLKEKRLSQADYQEGRN